MFLSFSLWKQTAISQNGSQFDGSRAASQKEAILEKCSLPKSDFKRMDTAGSNENTGSPKFIFIHEEKQTPTLELKWIDN